jgi:predicted dehydrogenase
MLRLGIVDFDSSHSVEFTQRFNHVGVAADQVVEGARVVLGCPGRSEMSPERIPGFTERVKSCGVELVDDPAAMLGRIDAVLILSIRGGAHLERVRPFLEAGLPAFVDKPFACTLADAQAMQQLAAAHGVPLISGSSMRFADEVVAFQRQAHLYGSLHGIVSYGPAKRAAGNPGLFHYGIHAAEVLFTLMGPGCTRVTATHTAGAEVVTGEWAGERVATLRGLRVGSTAYGFLAFCEKGIVHQSISTRYAYRNLCREIVQTFQTGQPTFPPLETLEIVNFIEAALRSEAAGGLPVSCPLGTGPSA